MAEYEIIFTDNSQEVLSALERGLLVAYEAVGQAMETHVKENCPVGTPESTSIKNYHGGSLRRSITHKVVDDSVYVGTNMRSPDNSPYPLFVEYGTGIYADDGKGRKSPWIWRDKNGRYHYTRGIKPTHFMRNAVYSDAHIKEYKAILKSYLKNS